MYSLARPSRLRLVSSSSSFARFSRSLVSVSMLLLTCSSCRLFDSSLFCLTKKYNSTIIVTTSSDIPQTAYISVEFCVVSLLWYVDTIIGSFCEISSILSLLLYDFASSMAVLIYTLALSIFSLSCLKRCMARSCMARFSLVQQRMSQILALIRYSSYFSIFSCAL